MSMIIAATLFCFLMAAISVYGYRRYARPAQLYEQLGAAPVAVRTPGTVQAAGQPGRIIRIIQHVGEKVPISPADVTLSRRYLIAAGFRSDTAVRVYYGIKVILCALFLALAFLFHAYVTSNYILSIALFVAAGLAGFFGPNLILECLVSRRHLELRLSLPDALDLLVICVEAGLALDQAILHVARELHMTHKEISEELTLVNLEMRAGKRRADALRNLAERTGEEELRRLVAVLVQTDRFGTSVAEALRAHSDFLRIRRRQEAEERANKVGVKLVFPIFFFILPSMLVVAAGPGLLQVFKYLFPMMRNFRM